MNEPQKWDAPLGPCDAEGNALAYVELANEAGDTLALCLHHFTSLEPALVAGGWTIRLDARQLLEVKP